MNIVHNCIDKWIINEAVQNRIAFIWESEEGNSKSFTYLELYRQVNKTANSLKQLGIKKSDIVALFMPMTPEIIFALFAIANIGGVVLLLFSGYGASTILQRLKDSNCKCLFTSDGVFRKGKIIYLKSIVEESLSDVSTVKHLIISKRFGTKINLKHNRDYLWSDLIDSQIDKCETENTSA